MGSVACSECGHVRWTPSSPCPACGAPRESILRQRTNEIAVPTPGLGPVPWVDGQWKEVPPPRALVRGPTFRPTRQTLALAVLCVALVALVLYSTDPGLFPVLSSRPGYVLVAAGEQWPMFQAQAGEPDPFTMTASGELRGSFVALGGPVELCVANDNLTRVDGWIFQCPNPYPYSSGFVNSSTISLELPAGPHVIFAYGPPATEGYQPWGANWSSPLEVVYGQ